MKRRRNSALSGKVVGLFAVVALSSNCYDPNDPRAGGGVGPPDDPPGERDAGEDVAPAEDLAPGVNVPDAGPQDVPAAPDVSPGVDRGVDRRDVAPDPDAPRLCYGPDEPNARFVGYEVPFCMTGVGWPGARVPTCWSEETLSRADLATVSRIVESIVRENFNRSTGIDFLGWKVCDRSPSPGRLVLSLTDDTTWSADRGFGAGGERHLSLGIKATSLASQTIEAFMQILGLTYRLGMRQPSPGTLLTNETAGLQVMFGRRPGGTVVGREARCLEARHGGADAGAPMAEPESPLQVNECLTNEWQDLQWNQDGALFLATSPDVFLEADPGGQTARLTSRKVDSMEQRWQIRGATLRTDGLKCIGVPGGNFFDGQVVTLMTCDGSAAQEWDVDLENGRLRHGDFCLGVPNGIARSGTALQIQSCRAGNTQTFTFRSNNQIQFQTLCLNVLGNTNTDDSPLALSVCIGGILAGNELFYLRGRIQNGDRCLEMPGEPGIRSIGLKTCAAAESQRWDIHMRPIQKR